MGLKLEKVKEILEQEGEIDIAKLIIMMGEVSKQAEHYFYMIRKLCVKGYLDTPKAKCVVEGDTIRLIPK